MHGMVESMVEGKTKKRLDIERIAQIKKATRVFLTLHGGLFTSAPNCGSHGGDL
jgi:fructose-bisphosphate aldolase class II